MGMHIQEPRRKAQLTCEKPYAHGQPRPGWSAGAENNKHANNRRQRGGHLATHGTQRHCGQSSTKGGCPIDTHAHTQKPPRQCAGGAEAQCRTTSQASQTAWGGREDIANIDTTNAHGILSDKMGPQHWPAMTTNQGALTPSRAGGAPKPWNSPTPDA